MSNDPWTLEAYLRTGQRPDVLLVDVNHPAGAQYFHNGLGIIEFEGKTYYGTGLLGALSFSGDGARIEITQVTATLSGVDEDTLALLDTSVKGGTMLVRHAFLRPDMSVDIVVEIENAELDYMTWKVGDGSGMIVMNALGGFRELRRRATAHWDREEQRNYLTKNGVDPDSDTGFDLMSQMRNTLVVSLAA